jgi:hypothetical protein
MVMQGELQKELKYFFFSMCYSLLGYVYFSQYVIACWDMYIFLSITSKQNEKEINLN